MKFIRLFAWPVIMTMCVIPGLGCSRIRSAASKVTDDYENFYSISTMGQLAGGLGVSVVLAHTNADREIRDWSQDSFRSEKSDDIARFVKPFGNGKYTIPAFLGVAVIAKMTKETPVGSLAEAWATRSLRTMFVGVPPLLLLQSAIGSARPKNDDSDWQPFENQQGVSGHSFMGAVPFLSAAMMSSNAYTKTLLYFGSTLCGLSRINDDKHYFSQVLMGWWLAYLSAKSVYNTARNTKTYFFTPIVYHGGTGITVNISF